MFSVCIALTNNGVKHPFGKTQTHLVGAEFDCSSARADGQHVVAPLLACGESGGWQTLVVRPLWFSRPMQLTLVGLVLCFVTAAVAESNQRALTGHVPLATKSAALVGDLPSSTELRLAIGLPLHDRQGLEDLLRQLYDPASTNYQRYLSVEQFVARFGPTEADYAKTVAFASSHQLRITAAHRNRLILDVQGKVADVEKAFGVRLRSYRHPREARTFYAPDTEPNVPNEIPILHVSGLDNFSVPRPAGLSRAPGSLAQPQAGAGPGGTFRGSDFRGAYARGVTLNGAGQMAGLLEFDGYYLSDITSYETQAALPNVPLMNVTMDGYDGTPGASSEEVSLDIEMLASMAPGLSAIIVYEAGANGLGDDVLNRMASDNLAKQLSSSWTYPTGPTTDQIFLELAAQGQTYFNASGDSGAYVGLVSSPADNPNVTCVGGTTLSTTGPGGAWVSETAWNRGTSGAAVAASGGGVSTLFAIPDWQKAVMMTANGGSITMRNLPDVAAVAENVWITLNNGANETVGGTSCSSPLWCGFMALVNQQAAGFGRPPIGFLNPALYRLGLSTGYNTNFHDITTGNNTTDTSPNEFFAVPGFDLCTGWGTPFGQGLINSLAPRVAAPLLTNVSSTILSEGCAPPNGALDPGETVTVSFSFKNIGGVKATNLAATLLSQGGVRWPSAPQTYGPMAAAGAAGSRSFTFTADGACGGTVLATLDLQDGTQNLGQLVFPFPLGKPTITFTQNFDSVVAPALPSDWTTMASNGVSLWITSTNAHDTAPNAVFADEPPFPGAEDLISPAVPVTTPSAQLSFRQSYNTEADPTDGTQAYDGGFLEIQIGTNGFTDILAAGGSFVSGGYNHVITTLTNSDNPFKGKAAWGGNSGGFVTTVLALPPQAAGQSVQFRWRFAVDTGNFFGGFGWYLDSISISDGATCCNPLADVQVLASVTPEPVAPGQTLTYSLAVTNVGPGAAYGTSITNSLPASLIFASGSAGCVFTNGAVVCDAGTLPAGNAANFSFAVLATASDPITNAVNLGAFTPDPDLSNNSVSLVSSIVTNAAPYVYLQSTNLAAVRGGAVTFQANAFGVGTLSYQWFFNGSLLPGSVSSSLALTNLNLSQAGSYWVQVTNLNGPTTSPVATLTVLEPPSLAVGSVDTSSGSVNFSLSSASGLIYTLQFKNALSDSTWVPILPAVAGSGGLISLVDTNAAGALSRFYRVVAQ